MICYEYSRDLVTTGRLYFLLSIVCFSLSWLPDALSLDGTIFFIAYFYFLLFLAIFFSLRGIYFILRKGSWYVRIDNNRFVWITPFKESEWVDTPLSDIKNFTILESKSSPETVYYYLYLKNGSKYTLDSESYANMDKITKCLKKTSVAVVNTYE